MGKFDINKVIEYYKVDTEDLARVLYPNVKYPKQAFDRVLKGEATLDVVQIELLASHLGVLVSELFSADSWKGSVDESRMAFTKGEYRAVLNYEGVFLSIYYKNKLIEQKISNVPNMTICEFINYLDNFIKNYTNGSN